MKHLLCFLFLFSTILLHAQNGASISFKKWTNLKQVSGPAMSPNGRYVVYTVTSTDWVNNSYDSELWLSKDGEAPFQLTRTPKGSSTSPQFTPDGRYISFIADRGEKPQLYLISVNGGEALQITKEDEGIASHEWKPDGKQIAFTRADADGKKEKATKEQYGAFAVEGEDFKRNHLWLLDFNLDTIVLAGQMPCAPRSDSTKADSLKKQSPQDCVMLPKAKRLTEGPFTVSSFAWSPDGATIAFNSQPDPLINSSIRSDVVLADVLSGRLDTAIAYPTGDFFLHWSPDGKSFVYSTSLTDSASFYYRNNRLFIYNMDTRQSREIAASVDENKSVVDWTKRGIYFTAFEKMKRKLYLIDPATGLAKPQDTNLDLVTDASFAKNADAVALAGRSYTGLSEMYRWTAGKPAQQLTSNTEQIKDWNTPLNEIVEWKSKDGATIQGVLLKPRNFDAGKKYPLLVVIHGGPTGIDLPDPTPTYVYPIMQ